MVYRGKPSKACLRCRQRRLKCDLQPVSCGSCARAGAICHGYRNAPALRILDETPSFPPRRELQRPRSLQQPIQWQARNAFLAHYVRATPRGWNFLMQYEDETAACVEMCIDAVSLAFIGHQLGSSSVMIVAREHYSTALRSIAVEIRSPREKTKKNLLSASLLLDLFAKITTMNLNDDGLWRGHIHGSLALIETIGLESLTSPNSLRLLSIFVTNCIISCVARGTAVPTQLTRICEHLEQYSLGLIEDPKWKLSRLMTKTAALREAIRDNEGTPHERVKTARAIDQKLLSLSESMPSTWQPVVTKDEAVAESSIFTYQDRHTTQVWNVLRLVRIQLHEYILENRAVSYEAKLEEEKEETDVRSIQALVNDVCSSVFPYAGGCCGLKSIEPSCHQNQEYNSGSPKRMHTPDQRLDAYILLFPLFIAGRSPHASPFQQAWVLQRLKFIHEHFDLGQASDLARIIREDPGRDPWIVYAMLGGYGFAAC